MKRFYVPKIPSSGEFIPHDELKHRLNEVLRFSEGDEIELIDGEGLFARARINGKGKSLSFFIDDVQNIQRPAKEVTVVASLIRRERFEILVEKAVELGASKIIPVVCERSRPYAEGSYDKLTERWQRIADQALSQCKRYFRCKVDEVIELKQLNVKKNKELQLLSFHPGLRPLTPNCIQKENSVMFAIGPEGGFTDKENELLASKGFEIYSLTDNILRTETAVMYVLSVLDISKKI